MNKFYNIPSDAKRRIYVATGEKSKLPPYAIEKDWWVVQTLFILFELEIGTHLVFKGGTSLSKVWNMIERFSEDIDLAVDRSFFGYEGYLGKSKRTKLRKDSNSYIRETLYPALKKAIISMLDNEFPNLPFSQEFILVPTVLPERTFLEKIFLLHEEFQRPKEKMRIDRLSRHLYDIYQISNTEFANKALKSRELYETIVKHRKSFTKLGGVDYNLHQPQSINFIPPKEIISHWENDYKLMQEQMIYGNTPEFDELIDSLKELKSKINNMKWKMDLNF